MFLKYSKLPHMLQMYFGVFLFALPSMHKASASLAACQLLGNSAICVTADHCARPCNAPCAGCRS